MSPVLSLQGVEQLRWFVAEHDAVIVAAWYTTTLFPSELTELVSCEAPKAALAVAAAYDLDRLVDAPVSTGDVLFFVNGKLISTAKPRRPTTNASTDLMELLAAIASKATEQYTKDHDAKRRREVRQHWMPHVQALRPRAPSPNEQSSHPLRFLGLTPQSTARDRKRVGRLVAKLLHDDRLHGFNDAERRQIRELHLFLMDELRKAA